MRSQVPVAAAEHVGLLRQAALQVGSRQDVALGQDAIDRLPQLEAVEHPGRAELDVARRSTRYSDTLSAVLPQRLAFGRGMIGSSRPCTRIRSKGSREKS